MTATLDAPRTKKDTATVTLTIARSALRTALTRLSGAVGSGVKALPVTHHIKLDVAPGSCTFTATDFDTWARLTIPCETNGVTVALLPAKRLAEIVANLPPVATVQLALSGHKGVLTAGRTRFEILGLPAAEFPNAMDVAGGARTVVNAAAFLDVVGRLAPLASTAESRAILNAVCLEPDGETLNLVVTDGSRMGRLVVPVSGDPLPRACLLHRMSVPMLARLFSGLAADATLSLGVDDARLVVESGDASASVRQVDGPYPAYRQLLNSHKPTRTVVCDRLLLSAAIRRVSLASGDDHRVVIELGDEVNKEITVRASDSDVGTAADVVAIETQSGDVLEPARPFALNAAFALSVLDTLTAHSVAIAYVAPERQVLFRPAEASDPSITLVMPLRII